LKELNKPFVVILNSNSPYSEVTKNLAHKLEEKYETTVIPADCSNLELDDINNIFGKILYEFPIERINMNFPKWADRLEETHWLKKQLFTEIKNSCSNVNLLKNIDYTISKLQNTEIISSSILNDIKLGTGEVNITINLHDELFYKIITEISGVQISNEGDLFATIAEFSKTKKRI